MKSRYFHAAAVLIFLVLASINAAARDGGRGGNGTAPGSGPAMQQEQMQTREQMQQMEEQRSQAQERSREQEMKGGGDEGKQLQEQEQERNRKEHAPRTGLCSRRRKGSKQNPKRRNDGGGLSGIKEGKTPPGCNNLHESHAEHFVRACRYETRKPRQLHTAAFACPVMQTPLSRQLLPLLPFSFAKLWTSGNGANKIIN